MRDMIFASCPFSSAGKYLATQLVYAPPESFTTPFFKHINVAAPGKQGYRKKFFQAINPKL